MAISSDYIQNLERGPCTPLIGVVEFKFEDLHQFFIDNKGAFKAYVGIDSSYSGTGISLLLETSSGLYATHTVAKALPPKKGKEAYSCELYERVEPILQVVYNNLPPASDCVVIMEGGALGSKFSAFMLGELSGAIKSVLGANKYKVRLVSPTSLKMYITGSGAAKKDVVVREVNTLLSLKLTNNNIADAYGLAFVGLKTYGNTR